MIRRAKPAESYLRFEMHQIINIKEIKNACFTYNASGWRFRAIA